MPSRGIFPAYGLAFGSNPVEQHAWQSDYSDRDFAQEASIPEKPDQRWRRRIAAKEDALEEIARKKLRRLLAHNRTFDYADAKVGGLVYLL